MCEKPAKNFPIKCQEYTDLCLFDNINIVLNQKYKQQNKEEGTREQERTNKYQV